MFKYNVLSIQGLIFSFSVQLLMTSLQMVYVYNHTLFVNTIICHFMTSEISIALDDASCMHVVCGITINISFHRCPSLVCM